MSLVLFNFKHIFWLTTSLIAALWVPWMVNGLIYQNRIVFLFTKKKRLIGSSLRLVRKTSNRASGFLMDST